MATIVNIAAPAAVNVTTHDVDIYSPSLIIEIDLLTVNAKTDYFITVISPKALPLTDRVSQSSSRKRKHRVLISQFGDGYGQFANDGINSQFDEWNIIYSVLTDSEALIVNNFFEETGVINWFLWTAIGDTVEKKWRIVKDTYTDVPISGDLRNISFKILQFFDLG